MSLVDLEEIMAEIIKFLPYAIPILIIEYGLMIFALVQLFKKEVKYLPKWGWALIIILVNIIGPVVFLVVGKKKDEE